jgi:outer membrane protein
MRYALAACVGLLAFAGNEVARAQDGREEPPRREGSSGREHASGHALTLGEVVASARSRSADAKEARAVAESAESAVDASYAGYIPRLSGDLGGNRLWSHSYQPNPATGTLAGTAADSLNTNVGGNLQWTAWDFGRTTSAVGAAKADAKSQSARASGVANEVAKTAAVLFLTAVFDEELVGAAQSTLRLREKHANLSRALVASGMRPPIEEARARVELLMAKLDVTKAEQQAAQDRVRLLTVLQMDPAESVHLVRPSVLPTLTADARRAADQALKNRPELEAANAGVTAQEENVDAAKAGRLPSIGVSLEGRHRTNKPDEDDRIFPTRSLTAMLTINVPIFDWAVWGRIPVAKSNLAAAESRAAGVRARIQGQAAEASYALQAAVSLVEQAKAARELAGATLAVMEARYQAGRDGPFDLFEAANKDREARTATIRAELALATATVESLAATGRIQELAR